MKQGMMGRRKGKQRSRVEKLDNWSKSWQRSFSFDFFISTHSDLSNGFPDKVLVLCGY